MKIMSLLTLLAVCACATPTERGIAAHMRHERNSILAEQAAAATSAQVEQGPVEKPE